MNKLKEFDAYGPMITSLVEMTLESTSGNALSKIVRLLKELRGKIEEQ